MKRALICSILAVLCASCTTVGTDYKRPANAVIDQKDANGNFKSGDNVAFSHEALPANWWKLYEDQTLNDLVQQALQANTDLRVAAANLQHSQAILDDARGNLGPSTSIEALQALDRESAEQLLLPTGGKPLPQGYVYGLSAGISYQVDLFGQINRSIEMAAANVAATKAAEDATRITVVAETTRAYLDVCSAGHDIDVLEKSAALQAQSTYLTKRLFQAGRGTSLDTTRSSSQEDQTRAYLPGLQAQKRLALYRLAVLTGHTPAEFSTAVAACHEEPRLKQPLPIGDGSALLKRRPDIRRAEYELHAATAKIGVATADLYPKVTLGASIGTVGLDSRFLHADTVKYNIGPMISWQFPLREHVKSQIRAANAEQQAAVAKFDGVVLNALRETESALEVYARDLDRKALLEQARNKSAKAVSDSEKLFKYGRSGYLPVLDANRSFISADRDLAAIEGKLADDQVSVFLALGGGWEEPVVPAKTVLTDNKVAVTKP